MQIEDLLLSDEEKDNTWIPCETCDIKPFWKSGGDSIRCLECCALMHRKASALHVLKEAEKYYRDVWGVHDKDVEKLIKELEV